jgi:hypothetical protein
VRVGIQCGTCRTVITCGAPISDTCYASFVSWWDVYFGLHVHCCCEDIHEMPAATLRNLKSPPSCEPHEEASCCVSWNKKSEAAYSAGIHVTLFSKCVLWMWYIPLRSWCPFTTDKNHLLSLFYSSPSYSKLFWKKWARKVPDTNLSVVEIILFCFWLLH